MHVLSAAETDSQLFKGWHKVLRQFQAVRGQPKNDVVMQYWRTGLCPISQWPGVFDPCTGNEPTAECPQSFVVTDDYYVTRRNYFIYAEGASSSSGIKAGRISRGRTRHTRLLVFILHTGSGPLWRSVLR